MSRKRGFNLHTPEALALAQESRRVAFLKRREGSQRSVFVVRLPAPSKGYGWEIRRFGNIVLSRGDAEYLTSNAAHLAGEAVMAQELI